jgi:hypothetical protein
MPRSNSQQKQTKKAFNDVSMKHQNRPAPTTQTKTYKPQVIQPQVKHVPCPYTNSCIEEVSWRLEENSELFNGCSNDEPLNL